MYKILCCLVSFLVVSYTLPVYASPFEPPKIAPVKKGEKAPFQGTIFNEAASAKIIVDLQNSEQQCQIKTNKELEKQQARHDLEMINLKAAKEATERREKEIVSLKNEQIKFLQEQNIKVAKKEKNVPAIIAGSLAGGVLAGVLLTVAAAFVVKEVRR